MHVLEAKLELPSDVVCVVPLLSTLVNTRVLSLTATKEQAFAGENLLNFLGQLPHTSVTFNTIKTSDDAMRREDDDAIIAFLFPPCGGARDWHHRGLTVSTAFLSKLLKVSVCLYIRERPENTLG